MFGGLARSLVRLMNKTKIPHAPSFEDGEPDKPSVYSWEGSAQLAALVEECVEFDPEQRPSLGDLKERIVGHTTGGRDDDLAKGLRTKKRIRDESLKLRFREDGYQIGLAKRRKV